MAKYIQVFVNVLGNIKIIGMINYEKQVEQEAAYPIAYPIPISYNCYRHEKRYQDCYASRCTKI